jgi:hypothetical protein
MATNMEQRSKPIVQHVSGSFDVTLTPQAPTAGESPAPGRMLIDKQFHGPLEAHSKGQMLAFGTSVKGSAGYVALELVEGKLEGRSGSFALQHSGTMNRGEPALVVSVVPDSGTGELAGLSGSMAIRIEAGKHYYDFEYSI